MGFDTAIETLERAERKAWRLPSRLPLDVWCETNIVLPKAVAFHHGPLSFRRTPYVREVLAAVSDPRTQEITLCWPTQSSKTTALIGIVLESLVVRRVAAMVVMPTEDLANSMAVERFKPIVEKSPRLWALHTGKKAELKSTLIVLNESQCHFAWAGSEPSVSSKSIGTLVCDEVDAYPPISARGSPIKKARERTRTFPDRIIIMSSTPSLEDGYIWKALTNKSTHEKYHVPCPHCGEFQVLQWGTRKGAGIHWNKGATVDDLREDPSLAWYECAHCEERILDRHKTEILDAGVWVPEGATVATAKRKRRHHHRGFWLWAAYSPFLTFAEIAAEFLESKDDPEDLQNFVNSWLALPWKPANRQIKLEVVEARRREDYKRGTVPSWARILVGAVDVQETGFYWAVRAWGLGERSVLVEHGFCQTHRELERGLFRGFPREGSKDHDEVSLVLIDSGTDTDAVYTWVKKHYPRVRATKGSDGYNVTTPIRLGKSRVRGVGLLVFKVSFWKDRLYNLMTRRGAEQWLLPGDVDHEYLEQLTSERRVYVKRGARRLPTWEPISEHAANHYWDVEVLLTIAADREGVRFLEETEGQEATAPAVQEDEDRGWVSRSERHRMRTGIKGKWIS